MNLTLEEHYQLARKLALKEYSKNASKGQSGYLPSLEGILKNTEIISEINLGIKEIPLKKIVGTFTYLRSRSFAKNFMPLLAYDTEFGKKWVNLCNAHLNEGIRDPIKVYEYLNWYYVVEGNKRVSILKYFNVYSFYAEITRLIPKYDETNLEIKIYYEFLNFNKITGINSIYFTKLGSFSKLLKILEKFNPKGLKFEENKYKYFEKHIYLNFRRIYLNEGGNKLPISTGDAFLEYINLYGLPTDIDDTLLAQRIRNLIPVLKSFSNIDEEEIQTSPENKNQNIISTISSLVNLKKNLKVAFIYASNPENSGWTYAHELGRRYVQEIFKDQILTDYYSNVPINEKSYDVIKSICEKKYDVIFTTSPIFLNSTVKCAIEYPNIKFFNCSEYRPYSNVGNYFGRTYEPRFLTGIIAGALTKSNLIGYVATSPTPEVISSINSFALGAKLVNPYSKILVSWTNEWYSKNKNEDADDKLIESGADIIANITIDENHPITKEYGVYSMLTSIENKKPIKYLAAPIWRWGIFYEKILKSILTNSIISDIFNNTNKLINFWWGIDSGVLDIYYYKDFIPLETQKLVEHMKKMIINNLFHPFTGPIYDKEGNLRVEQDEVATLEQILNMDWFVDGVEII
ncbi:Basic membrane lipoprotein Med, substrate-binding protein (PBP1-ABC) superfamily [Caloramator fervidus]|uniref:Basic membrane lipoprotein Med, substrate-binding protein (PBP1-ABC) superfamily n=1 Tax=Caloramator fervidus TaxID=29344 RepID=A0A1H5WYZ9_9CLOT|nr:BMP family ABC transporter substrate-binding protein [Caloramator fervidus]SEG04764.1 Basic membrane lipoprotein Med, substrate-binding protein (PBP1-ABC) superfamily [Caloramator fervidus]